MVERALTWVHDAATAVVFLTRIPVPWTIPDMHGRLRRCTPWFPVVGLGVGAVGAGAWWAAGLVWPPVLAAIAAVAATVLVTGAFHEDGLADTFDGLGGSTDRETALELMRDSRLGTYGAVTVVTVLAARVAALAGLGPMAPAALVGAHALARLSSLPLIRWLPYARVDGGAAEPFAGGVSTGGLSAAAAVGLAITALLWGPAAPAAWLAAAAVTALLGVWYRGRLAGITGDTLGAASQLVELVCYLALLATLP